MTPLITAILFYIGLLYVAYVSRPKMFFDDSGNVIPFGPNKPLSLSVTSTACAFLLYYLLVEKLI